MMFLGSRRMFRRLGIVKIFHIIHWSKGIKLSGSWNINFYIPLPPPVSALGINFGFSVSYSISG